MRRVRKQLAGEHVARDDDGGGQHHGAAEQPGPQRHLALDALGVGPVCSARASLGSPLRSCCRRDSRRRCAARCGRAGLQVGGRRAGSRRASFRRRRSLSWKACHRWSCQAVSCSAPTLWRARSTSRAELERGLHLSILVRGLHDVVVACDELAPGALSRDPSGAFRPSPFSTEAERSRVIPIPVRKPWSPIQPADTTSPRLNLCCHQTRDKMRTDEKRKNTDMRVEMLSQRDARLRSRNGCLAKRRRRRAAVAIRSESLKIFLGFGVENITQRQDVG